MGEREGAMVHHILENGSNPDSIETTFDPYDRQWDGLVDLKDDPLMRVMVNQIRDSITLSPELDELEPFEPSEE